MKEFDYIVQDPCGLHARPAGLLADFVRKHSSSTIIIEKKGRTVNAGNLMMLIGLRVLFGDCLHITVEGDEEERAAVELAAFLEKHL